MGDKMQPILDGEKNGMKRGQDTKFSVPGDASLQQLHPSHIRPHVLLTSGGSESCL